MDSETSIDETNLENLKFVADHLNVHSQLRLHEFNVLCDKSQRVHAGFIFYRDNITTDVVAQFCSEIYVILVRRIGATKDNCILSGWKDLGYHLGLSSEEINYINNTKNFVCPTDTILQVYSQKEEATVGNIVEALLTLQRLDVLEGIFDPLNNLIDILVTKYKNDNDQGYYSISSKDGTEILRPKFILNNLPEVLQWNRNKLIPLAKDKDNSFKDDSFKEGNSFDEETSLGKYSVMLTYCEDGLTIAQNVSREIQNFRDGDDRIRVICLENEKATVLTNPEQYIRNYFEEVDYVIPILTERYLDVIKSPNQILGSSMQNVDCKYARFIYTLMSTHYINGTGCLNKKVRPVLSQDINQKLISRLCTYPMLCVWTWENEFQKLLHSLFPKDSEEKK